MINLIKNINTISGMGMDRKEKGRIILLKSGSLLSSFPILSFLVLFFSFVGAFLVSLIVVRPESGWVLSLLSISLYPSSYSTQPLLNADPDHPPTPSHQPTCHHILAPTRCALSALTRVACPIPSSLATAR